MTLKFHNTLTGHIDEFVSQTAEKALVYTCGPTVYDYSHIGHAKNYIAFDAFVKYLRAQKFNVFYLQNITDIDDKIIARAREKGVPPKDLAIALKPIIKDK